MASNSFGNILKLTTFGESHGEAIGGILDGFPAGLEVDFDAINFEMSRRKPGQSKVTTQRKESDKPTFLSGIFEGKTTGMPIAWTIENSNKKSKDYDHIKSTYRPNHADFTYQEKYGIRDYQGGGRSSARETANWVLAGALAKQLLKQKGIQIKAFVSAIGQKAIPVKATIDFSIVENNILRTANKEYAIIFEEYLKKIKKAGDTVGGVISAVIQNLPVGLGEPIFEKLHANLGKALFIINAVKGVEFGSGFEAAKMLGSQHNDIFFKQEDKIITKTNNSGGIQGGISNGMPINFRVAFKPVATLMQSQTTVNEDGEAVQMQGKGRHDPCVVPRAVPIVEAMSALVLADHLLLQRTNRI